MLGGDSHQHAVKLVDLFNHSMKVVSVGIVHGNACSHLVMSVKRVYLYQGYWFLENTQRFKKAYSARDLLTRTFCTVYVPAGVDSDR